MNILKEIQNGIEDGRACAESVHGEYPQLSAVHKYDYSSDRMGKVFQCDNLKLMKKLLDEGYAGKIQTIYIDPPFFSRAKYKASITIKTGKGAKKIHYKAYDDGSTDDLKNYIAFMTARLLLMKKLLADDGLIWVHLDWHSSHYIRILMDEIFGEDRFVNEIIWKYKSGGSSQNHFSRKHDTIILYSKSPRYYINIPKEKSYNRGLKPYRFKGVKEYQDDFGWYTLVNMKDVWNIDMVGRTSAERNGYATQKPLELMKRIVEVSSREGDLCADFFFGSGSFVHAADLLKRNWIGCDNEKLAAATSRKRLGLETSNFECYFNGVPGSGIKFDVDRTEELKNGKKLLTCKINSFIPSVDLNNVVPKDRAVLKNIIETEPLALIDVIMVDNDFRGRFMPELVLYSADREIKFISRGNVKFIAVDIFGNEYEYEL